jgi:opacity protein-like surface antigen
MHYWDKKYGRRALGIVLFTVFAAAMVLISMPARAADLGGSGGSMLGPLTATSATPWTGLYVGAGAGYQVADTELSVPGTSIVDGLSGHGWAADGRLGFDWQASGTPIVVGVLGGYNIGEAEFKALNGAISATLEPTLYAGGRVGVALPTKTLLYGGAAYQQAKGTVTFGPGSASDTQNGVMYLAGIEQLVAPGLSIGAEYSLSQYEFSAGSLSIDPDVHAFKARLTWRPFAK